MTLSDLASIATVVSGLAVLVSLVYLSLQTRQNTKHTMALIEQGRAEQAIGYWFTMAQDGTLTEALLKSEALDPSLDRVQFMRYFCTSGASISSYENQFYQHRDGLLDDERYAASTKMVAGTCELGVPGCGLRLSVGPSVTLSAQASLDGLRNSDVAASRWKF